MSVFLWIVGCDFGACGRGCLEVLRWRPKYRHLVALRAQFRVVPHVRTPYIFWLAIGDRGMKSGGWTDQSVQSILKRRLETEDQVKLFEVPALSFFTLNGAFLYPLGDGGTPPPRKLPAFLCRPEERNKMLKKKKKKKIRTTGRRR